MKKHIIAMIIMAAGSVIGLLAGLIVLLSTDYNWIAAVITTVVIVVVMGFIGFVIAAINMIHIAKNPSRMLS